MDRSLKAAALVIGLLMFAALGAAACGDDSSSSDSKTTTTTQKASGGGGQVDAKLDIRMEHVAEKGQPNVPTPTRLKCTKSIPATCTGTLECPSTDAADANACNWLAEHHAELAKHDGEPAGGRACTMQYGGPATVSITGTVNGDEISAKFSRQDGCAISDWENATPLWTA